MGHLNHRALKILGEVATRMPPCNVGHKYNKTSFPSRDDKAKDRLALIHSDVCGPFSSPSLHGFMYYVIFIDDILIKLGYF